MAYLKIVLGVCTCLLQCAGILADKCGKESCSEDGEGDNLRIIVICTLVGTLVICLVVGLIFYCIASKKKQQNMSITPGQEVTIVGRVQFAQPGPSTLCPPAYGTTGNYPMDAPPKYESFPEGPHPFPQGRTNEDGDMHKTPL